MEKSIVMAMVIIGSIFLVFAVIFAIGEISTRKALTRSKAGRIAKLIQLKEKGILTSEGEEMLAQLQMEVNTEAAQQIDNREQRAAVRDEAKGRNAFRKYVSTKLNKGKPSKELIVEIRKDNQEVGLASYPEELLALS